MKAINKIKKLPVVEVVNKDVQTLGKVSSYLPVNKPEYGFMLDNIKEKMPSVLKSESNFHKSHSQFMNVTIDVTQLTPMRSIKHTLAEIDQTRQAVTSTYFRVKKNKIKIEQLKQKYEKATDFYEKQLLALDIEEQEAGVEYTRELVAGSVRKLNFFINQYDNLIKKLGKDFITEEEYEKEEVKYHLMTAIKQALVAARARGGTIDEGNHIYLFELGVNGAQAQLEFDAYFHTEMELLKEGKAPTHEMTLQWMEALSEKWADNPVYFATRRGFEVLDKQSLTNVSLLKGDK